MRIDPVQADNSINDFVLLTRSSNGKIWLTQYQYLNSITNPRQLETMFHRQDLWIQTAGRFSSGATMRLDDIQNATPTGTNNMKNSVPQWNVTSKIPPESLKIIGRLLP